MKVTKQTVWETDSGRQLLRVENDDKPARSFIVVPSGVDRQELRELALAIEDALKQTEG